MRLSAKLTLTPDSSSHCSKEHQHIIELSKGNPKFRTLLSLAPLAAKEAVK